MRLIVESFHDASNPSVDIAVEEIMLTFKRGGEGQRALELAAIRLGILADRMEGCNDVAREEGRPPTHELLSEARAFETEAREAAGMPPR